jgi:SAM-dependent methyltransferase
VPSTFLDTYKKAFIFSGNEVKGIHFVGANGEFEEKTQYEFMLDHGIKSHHKFLDLACGCLRGTIKLVDYLDNGNFYGADVSKGLLDLIPARLESKRIKNTPNIFCLDDYDVSAMGTKFDFILSVSLLTHLLPDQIQPLFEGIRNCLSKKGVWFFTIYPVRDVTFKGTIGCAYYDPKYLIEVGKENGLKVSELEGDFDNHAPGFRLIDKVNSTLGQWVMKAVKE